MHATHSSFCSWLSHAPWSPQRASSSMMSHSLCTQSSHVNCVQFSFHDPTIPPPFWPAGVSAHVNSAVGCLILHSFFCFRLPLLFLALISFSTEDSFFHVFKSSWCAVLSPPSLVVVSSTQPNLFVSALCVRIPPSPFHSGHPTRRQLVLARSPRTGLFLCPAEE